MDYKNKEDLQALAKTHTDDELAARFGISRSSVRKWRRAFGISSLYPASSARYAFNRGYFHTIDSPEKAYVLGFIIADGHVSQHDVAIDLIETDQQILYDIRACMNADAVPIRRIVFKQSDEFTRNPAAKLKLCGVQMVADLRALGLYSDKTLTATYPNIPPELDSHCIRGIFDGDGSITHKQFNLLGTPMLMNAIRQRLHAATGCTLHYYAKTETLSYITGSRKDTAALAWLYRDATIALQRKRNRYLQYWVSSSVQSL